MNAPLSWEDLRDLPLFGSLPPEDLQALTRDARWLRLGVGQSMLTEASRDVLILLVRGHVDVLFYGYSGRTLQLGRLEPGRMVATPAPMLALGQHLTLVAVSDAVALCLSRVALEQVCLRHAAFTHALMRMAEEVAWSLAARVLSLGVMTVPERLRAHLLSLAHQVGIVDNQARLTPAPRQTALAAQLGCSREEVAREMARLRRLGWLRREAPALVLTDVQALQTSLAV